MRRSHRSVQLVYDGILLAGVVLYTPALPSNWRGPHFLIDGVSSQPKRPQARGLFAHRLQFGLVLGHCLLGLVRLLFFLEQRFGTAVCLVGIHAQYGTPGKSP